MPRPIIVFGINEFASAFAELVRDEGDLEPVAFTVERPWVVGDEHEGLPLVALEDLDRRFAPDSVEVLVPLGFREMMGLRRRVCERVRDLGFPLGSWVSRRANVWSRLEIGPNTTILPGTTVMPHVRIAEDVSIRVDVTVSHHTVIEAHSTLANGVTTGGCTRIGPHAWVGLGAVLRDDVEIAPGSFVGMGAVVVDDTEPDGVYVGVPARRLPGVSAMERTSS